MKLKYILKGASQSVRFQRLIKKLEALDEQGREAEKARLENLILKARAERAKLEEKG